MMSNSGSLAIDVKQNLIDFSDLSILINSRHYYFLYETFKKLELLAQWAQCISYFPYLTNYGGILQRKL